MKEDLLKRYFKNDRVISYSGFCQCNVALDVKLCATDDDYVMYYNDKFYIPDSLDDFTEHYSKELTLEEAIKYIKDNNAQEIVYKESCVSKNKLSRIKDIMEDFWKDAEEQDFRQWHLGPRHCMNVAREVIDIIEEE